MDKKERVALATAVMKKRLDQKLQIPEAAEQMGVSHQTVRDIENVNRNSTEPIRKKVYQWLGTEPPPAVPRKYNGKRKPHARRTRAPKGKSPATAPHGLLNRLQGIEADIVTLKKFMFGK